MCYLRFTTGPGGRGPRLGPHPRRGFTGGHPPPPRNSSQPQAHEPGCPFLSFYSLFWWQRRRRGGEGSGGHQGPVRGGRAQVPRAAWRPGGAPLTSSILSSSSESDSGSDPDSDSGSEPLSPAWGWGWGRARRLAGVAMLLRRAGARQPEGRGGGSGGGQARCPLGGGPAAGPAPRRAPGLSVALPLPAGPGSSDGARGRAVGPAGPWAAPPPGVWWPQRGRGFQAGVGVCRACPRWNPGRGCVKGRRPWGGLPGPPGRVESRGGKRPGPPLSGVLTTPGFPLRAAGVTCFKRNTLF